MPSWLKELLCYPTPLRTSPPQDQNKHADGDRGREVLLSFRLTHLQTGQKGAALPSPHTTGTISRTLAISHFLVARFPKQLKEPGELQGSSCSFGSIWDFGCSPPGCRPGTRSDLKGRAGPPQAPGLAQKRGRFGPASPQRVAQQLPARWDQHLPLSPCQQAPCLWLH